MWELERGGVWNSWKYVGYPASALVSHATIMNDDKGWWVAYAVSLFLFRNYYNSMSFSLAEMKE